MRKLISFMHISLDGFVAGPNGEIDWIKVNEEIFDHVGKRIGMTDTAMYGRATYQMMESYWPTAGNSPKASKHDIEHSRWYSNVHKVVLSKTMSSAGLTNTTVINNDLVNRINKIKQQPGSEILLFGSPTATHALLQLGLIDGFWLFVNPVVLGKGIPLFTDIREKIKLQLLKSKQFECGVVEVSYIVEG